MEDKRSDLDAEKRRKLLQRMVEELSKSRPDFYYQPTSEIARSLKGLVDRGDGLTQDEVDLLKPLSERDIQVVLSLHS